MQYTKVHRKEGKQSSSLHVSRCLSFENMTCEWGSLMVMWAPQAQPRQQMQHSGQHVAAMMLVVVLLGVLLCFLHQLQGLVEVGIVVQAFRRWLNECGAVHSRTSGAESAELLAQVDGRLQAYSVEATRSSFPLPHARCMVMTRLHCPSERHPHNTHRQSSS